VTLIVTVCKLSEGGRPKCHKYWPDEDSIDDLNFAPLVEDMRVSVKSVRKLGKYLDERIFEIQDGAG
jgi:protein tyrosine phosphatase